MSTEEFFIFNIFKYDITFNIINLDFVQYLMLCGGTVRAQNIQTTNINMHNDSCL